MGKKSFNTEDGVSEAIGFMIMFALVMTGIGLITLYGYPMLMKEQANANIRNMERNMIVMQNDLKSLTFKNVPYQETDFQVSGGSLSIVPAISTQQLRITNGLGGPDVVITGNPYTTGALRYESDREGAVVSLENGAVLKRYQNQAGSVMLAEPRWFYDSTTTPDTMVIPVIRLTASQPMSQSGVGRVRLTITGTNQNEIPDATGMYVHYSQNPSDDFSTAWTNYFQQSDLNLGANGAIPPGTRLFIKVYDVTVIGL